MNHPSEFARPSANRTSPARVALLSLSIGAAGMAVLAGLAGWRGAEPPREPAPAAAAAKSVAPSLPDRAVLAQRAQQASEFAKLVQAYLDHDFLLENEKATLRARAAILAAHAREQAERVRTLAGVDDSQATYTILDLGARANGLDDERRQLEQEWSVWQVRHGLVKPEQTELVYERVPGDGC